MDDGKDNICVFPTATDVLADILTRLPPNARRRLRLVCQLWRDVVDERAAADMRSRAKILAVTTEGAAYVVDVLSPGSLTDLWQRPLAVKAYAGPMSVVGTCNGLVCLCEDQEPGGAITLANPATGEELRLPPLPMPNASVRLYRNSSRSWHQTYAFACHPTTGQYKVVHVPCCFDPFWEPGVLHVFTLGDASWRDVQAGPDARCSLGRSSLVDVDGMVYWMTEFTARVMAFDLEDERVTRTAPLPVPVRPSACRLTKVHARLGVAVSGGDSLTVWVLEGESWSRRYVLEAYKLRKQELAVPHFAHGDYVLTHGRSGETNF
ncbi:hypothetical protein QYE76_058262 [Lolium multiflorum]|uniref:F-box domain-containing protein n=1 Tax=Lolium multiflorum TaxID=4521 RepID=A0AAD8WRG7_LOLMU|nr:hypothetical protein QYE76_058262 [Lolium multiflorum]